MSTANLTLRRALQKLLDAARRLDIGDNPAPEALYEPGSAAIQIWATPDDPAHDQVQMDAGAFTKPKPRFHCFSGAVARWAIALASTSRHQIGSQEQMCYNPIA